MDLGIRRCRTHEQTSVSFGETPRAGRSARAQTAFFVAHVCVIILLVVSVLSAGNALALEKLLKMQVFSVVASMGVGSYWVAMAFLAALILHLYTCRRFSTGRCARSAAPCAR